MSPVPNFAPYDHPATAPFWSATAQGGLALPCCPVCGTWQWYPTAGAPCHPGTGPEWRPVPPHGAIYTFTRVQRAFLPSGGDPPYTLALVELDGVDGARVLSVLVGPGSEDPAIGDRVRLAPTRLDTHTLPTFELAA